MNSLLLYVFVLMGALPAQWRFGCAPPASSTTQACLSPEEFKIYEQLNAYRKTYRLGKIPLSVSLTLVAQAHAKDLALNQPVKGQCNLHSWSDQGDWTACCYTNDHKRATCMWDKPRELSDYPGDGYEISYWQSDGATAATAIAGWKKSPGHNNMMINRDIWRKLTWNACGVGLYGNYAVVWFGKEKDPAGEAKKCL
jgi:hypothetical protein